jgi:integrase
MSDVHSLIEPYFSWKQAPGKHFAASSKRKYEPLLLEFARWAGARDVASITSADLEFEFLPHWTNEFVTRNGHKPALNTVRLTHNILASFFNYCLRRGLVAINPMAAIPRPAYQVYLNGWLSPEEDEAMARVAKTPLEEIVYDLGRLAGLRCAEITGLLSNDVALSEDLIHVQGTKSPESIRSVVVFPELAEAIHRWRAHQQARGLTETRYLVTSASGRRLSSPYAWRCIKRVAARAGVRLHGRDDKGRPLALDAAGENVSRVTTHTLRRTYGADLLNRGVRIEAVSAQLGHASVKITEQAYARLRTETQRKELLRLGTGFAFTVISPNCGCRFARRL